MYSLLVIDSILLAVVLDLMKSRGKCMKETRQYESVCAKQIRKTRDLRADDTKDECTPR
jgi:hypothetical protein